MGIFPICCPDINFVCKSDVNNGCLSTIVEYPSANKLDHFCEYANLNARKKVKEVYPSLATFQYKFYKTEIARMLEYLSEQINVNLDGLLVYKLYLSGIRGEDSKTLELTSIDFCVNAVCKRKSIEEKEVMKYNYNWRSESYVCSPRNGEPTQKVVSLAYNKDTFIDEY